MSSTYASTSTSSTEVCGNQLYYLNVPNIGCDGVITFNVVGNYGSSFGSEITWEVVRRALFERPGGFR